MVAPTEYITRLGLESSATKVMPSRTTIIAITGATLGQVSLAELETCANQSVVGVIGTRQLPSEFVYFWVKQNIGELLASQTGGAQQHINKANIDDLRVLVPPEMVLAEYSAAVRPLFDRIKVCCYESQTLALLREALLAHFMSCGFVAPDACEAARAT